MVQGGYRSGRRHLPVESCHSFSAWEYFIPAQMVGDDTFRIYWDFDEESCHLKLKRHGHKWEQTIPLIWQACGYGGKRAWFRCPRCSRRAGKVYLPAIVFSNGRRARYFLCRHCYSLTYLQNQRHNQTDPLRYRAERIAERWLGELEEDRIGKKKRQHWKTFHKRADQYEQLVKQSNAETNARFFAAYLSIMRRKKPRA